MRKAPIKGLLLCPYFNSFRGKFIYTSFHIGNIFFRFMKLKGVSLYSCKVS